MDRRVTVLEGRRGPSPGSWRFDGPAQSDGRVYRVLAIEVPHHPGRDAGALAVASVSNAREVSAGVTVGRSSSSVWTPVGVLVARCSSSATGAPSLVLEPLASCGASTATEFEMGAPHMDVSLRWGPGGDPDPSTSTARLVVEERARGRATDGVFR